MSPLLQPDGKSHLLLNPRLLDEDCKLYESFFRESEERAKTDSKFRDLIWILSSGSSRGANESAKLIGLPKKSILASAAANNKALNLQTSDNWAQSLPSFHVGGLAIEARTSLAGARRTFWNSEASLSEEKNARAFTEWIADHHITILSLVPTQVFDLVKAGCVAPLCVRAIMVSGAAMDLGLFIQAREMHWPLLLGFGMTEACSNIALSSLETLSRMPRQLPRLRLLDHVEVRSEEDGCFSLRGSSMLAGYWQERNGQRLFVDPKDKNGWYSTQDLVEITNESKATYLRPLGRASDFVKINGEGVDLASLRGRFADFLRSRGFHENLALVDVPDARRGVEVVCVIEVSEKIEVLKSLIQEWNRQAFPLERLQRIESVKQFPRSDIGKLLLPELRKLIS